MEIQYAKNPTWAAFDSTSINLTVKFSAFDFEVPFSASSQDSELHGRQIFARASEGEFGPVASYVAPVPSPDEVQRIIVADTQKRLDLWAATRNYDGILSACTYATSSVPKFAAEGQAAVNARDVTWSALYAVLADVQSGARPMPSGFEDVEPLLPALEWPL